MDQSVRVDNGADMNYQVALNENGSQNVNTKERIAWRVAQTLTWLVGVAILVLLVVAPSVGLFVLWSVLISVAPALLAIAPGIWRNICPLGTTSQIARHFGFSRGRKLTNRQQASLQFAGVVLLLLMVPLRHPVLNVDAFALFIALMIFALAALGMGTGFAGKSGWCNGICPVLPVEKLYGQLPLFSTGNAHCSHCVRCVSICPDSTAAMHPKYNNAECVEDRGRKPFSILGLNRAASWVLVAGFPGYIWGWFQVADALPGEAWSRLGEAYGFPLFGMALSIATYCLWAHFLSPTGRATLDRGFAASAISMYYWFRMPAMIGHGKGVVVDLTNLIGPEMVLPLQLLNVGFWVWWFLLRKKTGRSWQIRPASSVSLVETAKVH